MISIYEMYKHRMPGSKASMGGRAGLRRVNCGMRTIAVVAGSNEN